MKRIFPLFTALTLVLAACGGDGAATSTSAAEGAATTADPTSIPGSADASMLAPGTVTAAVVPVGEAVRSYLVAVPPGYSPGVPAPLVFDLHGRGATAADQALTSGITELAWPHGFVVVHPQAIGEIPGWSSFPGMTEVEGELAFFQTMLDTLSADLAIDQDRIFVTGFSNGGGMAARLACDLDAVDGLAVVAASLEGWLDCDPAGPIPVLAIHGIDDPVAPYDGVPEFLPAMPDWAAWWAAADGCGRDPVPVQTVTGWLWYWPVCDGGATVTLMALTGVGHVWPQRVQSVEQDGADQWLSATQIIVDFLAGL